MKVRITFNLDRRTTSAIAERIGKHRNATYDECRNHIEAIVDASLQVTLSEYDEHLPEPCETCDCPRFLLRFRRIASTPTGPFE